MSPRAKRFALVGYLVVVFVGFSLYKTFSAEIEAHLFAMRGLDSWASWGWASWTQHVIGAATLFGAFVVSIFFSIPVGPLFYVAFGYFYGPYEGTILAAVAATIASLAAFCFFRNAIPQSDALKRVPVNNVFLTLLLLRSSPWIPNPLITVFCSAFDVGITTFTLTTFLGTMPLIAVYTLAASRLHDHLEISALYSTELAVALGLLSAISVLGFLKPLRTVLDYLKAIQIRDAADDAIRPGRLRKNIKIA